MTLVKFLLARIAEDESVARDAAESEIHTVEHEMQERWSPERVLAECEAKRRIVKESAYELNRRPPSPRAATAARVTLLLLALPYADHPDYQQEWAL